MAEFRLERFKYNWKGDWSTATDYKRDDVVRVNGKSYVCCVTHTSAPSFRTDLLAIIPGSNPPIPHPYWVVMTSGTAFVGNYQIGRDYNLGDIVLNDGILWLCTFSHNSTGSSAEAVYWDTFSQGIVKDGNWQQTKIYGPGAIVKYNGNSYKCIAQHTSQSRLEDDNNSWTIFYEGVEYVSNWQTNTEYRLNDLVKYGGTLFRCIETHLSSGGALSDEKFQVEFPGSQFDNEWNSTTYYNEGDVVRHNGYVYYSITNNINSRPWKEEGSLDWILLANSYKFIGGWSVDTAYETGDVVLRGGNLYMALVDVNAGGLDASTLDYLQDDIWELLVPGSAWKGNWTLGNSYETGDVIYYKGDSYTCNFAHDSSLENFPGDNGNIYNYWDLFIEATNPAGLKNKGDLLTYGLSRDLSGVQDTSTLGVADVPIGSPEQLLSVTQNLEVYWRDIVVDADRIFVSLNGIDGPNRGTQEKPFRTIRYAAEFVEDNFNPGDPVIIKVSTGRFEEILPIVVPKGCAINGDELRSTTVTPNRAMPEYASHLEYVRNYLGYLPSIFLDVITGVPITKTVGNDETQITIDNYIPTNDYPDFPVSNVAISSVVVNLSNNILDVIDFNTLSGNTNPAITGSNTISVDFARTDASEALRLNREFVKKELIAYTKNANPNITFDDVMLTNNIDSFLRAFIYDLKYGGNYASIRAGIRYSNAVNGSQLADMFLMRDSTGLRDLTTAGLSGVLQPPQVFDLYQKPTGGACVALDPGWGQLDESVWITNRSPYIQGVTNTGTGCVGKRVDGSLHSGGNKSMVSNDFTQVLSDGIGVWVSDNARVELVSVFTYYCQIGYLAEDGGIIRATNGNNSYGKYGAIADGSDETEIPQDVTVFNRNNEAEVYQAFAGGNIDEIFAFEYTNCGEEYTEADAEIIGAGANADVEYSDFRDGGLYEARLSKTYGDSGDGRGSGYLVRQGSAQETLTNTTVKLSANDVTLDVSEILGMRLILTDGKGVGQYGIVNSFNFITKEVAILRESDGMPGWDHIIPGYPIEASLDLTTRYRIEARLTVSAPGFTSSNYNLFANRTYVDIEWNNTKQTFTNVIGDANIPWVDDSGTAVTINTIVSEQSIQVLGSFASNPRVPFEIQGNTSGTTANVTAITANTGSILEVDLSGNGNNFTQGETITIILVSGTGDTFDDDPIPASFDVVRVGSTYTLTVNAPGAGYVVGDEITLLGNLVGGVSPANDITITVTGVSDDSTSSIQTFTHTGTSLPKRFVALTNAEYVQYSDNGQNWTELSLPFIGNYTSLISSDIGIFVAIASGTNQTAYSLTGETWNTASLPAVANWQDGVYGGGKFVVVANDTSDVAVSTNGTSWSTANIPDDVGGDGSTVSQWSFVTYGKGIHLAVSANDGATATSTDGGTTWIRNDEVLPDLSPADDWDIVGVVYGRNRFLIVDSLGRTSYSFDGVTWYQGNSITSVTPTEVKYGNGLFFVLGLDAGDGTSPTSSCVTTEDGLIWNTRTLSTSKLWRGLVNSNLNGVNTWVLLANAADTSAIEHVVTGATAKVRSDVLEGRMERVKIWDPGSGYTTSPTITVVDPNSDTDILPENRISNGVLAQPDFINRGSGYRTSSSTINISGNGFADIKPESTTLTLAGISSLPGPGVQIRISSIPNYDTEDDLTDLKVYSGVEVFDLGDDGSGNGTKIVKFTISPGLSKEFAPDHAVAATLRENYSQCRISGHDFLDIGTGNFEQTNYPEVYSGGRFFTALPENEVYEANGGRVFYTSTDQDGNFRTGELFAVNQATGIVTVSAQFFELEGLSELALGGVRLGGSGTVVNEFSTDPTFIADSNNIIPTQRAIATFLANRLSVGGENLEVNRFVAGRISVGGFADDIYNITGEYTSIPVPVVIKGTYTDEDELVHPVGIQGTIIGQMMMLKTFDETMQ